MGAYEDRIPGEFPRIRVTAPQNADERSYALELVIRYARTLKFVL
jgi:hypothetical protein